MTKALLIDDEPHANALLKILLEKHFPFLIEVVGIAQSIQDARAIILQETVDIVFLDIQMPDEDGFCLFKYFPEPHFDVIFTTAYDQFAIKAFRYSAFDYILKPLDKDNLEETIHRYLSKRSILKLQKEQISLLSSYVNRAEEGNRRIFFHTISGIEMPFIKDIIYIKADGNYCEIYCDKNGKIVVTQTLKEILERLDSPKFLKIHRSHAISLAAVMRYNKKEKTVILNNGCSLEVSHREEKRFLAKFETV